jgi:endonuclease/exonuclease/phosphatase family metal-dependent hydrolase
MTTPIAGTVRLHAPGTLVRSWNVFHGRLHPPGDVDFLEPAVRLACADGPDVLCLQEVPPWALGRLSDWTQMQCFGDLVRRPSLGPVPVSRSLGRRLTAINPKLLRSAFSGQANAILVRPELLAHDHRSRCLNPGELRRLLGSQREPRRARRAWGRERRSCQAVRLTLPDGRPALVANLHATCRPSLAELELVHALAWLEGLAQSGDVVVLAGDFNLEAASSPLFAMLARRGFSGPGDCIDHVLVRGAAVSPVVSWALGRRRLGGALLSDHTPVELTIAAA